MSEKQAAGRDDVCDQYSVLADQRHRRALSVLLTRTRPIAVRDLAARIATEETETPPAAVSEANRRRVRIDLRHRILPRLESTGWLAHHSAGVVAEEPVSPPLRYLPLGDLGDGDDKFWVMAGTVFARPRRWALLAVVAGQSRPIHLEALATELTERDWASWVGDPGTGDTSVLPALYHVDLPKMADVGLIEFDPDTKTVAPAPALHTFLDRLEIDCDLIDELAAE